MARAHQSARYAAEVAIARSAISEAQFGHHLGNSSWNGCAARGNASLSDPAALSPVLIIAALDGNFGRYMPLRADPDIDCLVRVEVQ